MIHVRAMKILLLGPNIPLTHSTVSLVFRFSASCASLSAGLVAQAWNTSSWRPTLLDVNALNTTGGSQKVVAGNRKGPPEAVATKRGNVEDQIDEDPCNGGHAQIRQYMSEGHGWQGFFLRNHF